jgi:hypothetical protein
MRGSAFLPMAVLLLSLASPKTAGAAPTRQACVSAYEETQVSMRRSRLLAARGTLQTCLDEACPAFLRADCAGWLKEVEARTPSVVVEVLADGVVVRDVRLVVDGSARDGGVDGKSIELDPGTHSFKVEPPGAVSPVSVEVVIREGEKLKLIRIELPGREKPAPPPPPTKETPTTPPVQTEQRRPVPWTVYAAGGLGLAAAAGFGTFAVLGASGKSDLEPCKPECSQGQIDDVQTKFLVADILLGVSVVALVAAAYLYVSRPSITTTMGSRAQAFVFPRSPLPVSASGAFVF